MGPNIYVAIVDDEEAVRRSMVRLLSAAAFHPVPYASAEEFLADRKRPDFDCLVLDVRLEGITGIELQRQLVNAGSTTPVIFMTAYDDARTREEARAAGCAAYFRKADAGRAIVETITALVEEPRESC